MAADNSLGYRRKWEDSTYSTRDGRGRHLAHAPIYGFGQGPSGLNHLARLARLFRILKFLNKLEFGSLLDVGGGEGFNAYRISKLFGVKAACTDISVVACRHARDLFGIPSYALSADRRLPFQDNTFDVVLCSEVIEHLNDPVQAVSELLRVSSGAVIVTTQENVLSRFERWLLVSQIDLTHFQNEKNYFIPDDFRHLMGRSVVLTEQMNVAGFVWNRDESLLSRQQAADIITTLTERDGFGYGSFGIMATCTKGSSIRREQRFSELQLIDHLLDYPGVQDDSTHAITRGGPNEFPPIESFLCPECHSEVALEISVTSMRCEEGHVFSVVDGVPDFVERQRELTTFELSRMFEPNVVYSVLQMREAYAQRNPEVRTLAAQIAPLATKGIHFLAHPIASIRRRLGYYDKRFVALRAVPEVSHFRDGFYDGYDEHPT